MATNAMLVGTRVDVIWGVYCVTIGAQIVFGLAAAIFSVLGAAVLTLASVCIGGVGAATKRSNLVLLYGVSQFLLGMVFATMIAVSADNSAWWSGATEDASTRGLHTDPRSLMALGVIHVLTNLMSAVIVTAVVYILNTNSQKCMGKKLDVENGKCDQWPNHVLKTSVDPQHGYVVDSHVVDALVDTHVVDSHVDSHVVDSHVVDPHVVDPHVVDALVVDNVDTHVVDALVVDNVDTHVVDNVDTHVVDSHVDLDACVFDPHVDLDACVFAPHGADKRVRGAPTQSSSSAPSPIPSIGAPPITTTMTVMHMSSHQSSPLKETRNAVWPTPAFSSPRCRFASLTGPVAWTPSCWSEDRGRRLQFPDGSDVFSQNITTTIV
eukprot:CAMPEP_0113845776 /NCGR_PEP_ID=MMETSP0372-20130328/944_1 /TAXON_ID=340204 /ORGANISM="Lankesteria abbotti" /LENGTH=378 /DNA_ID=CAMNT_0000814855 /DNA_START=132 /DNA_END=1268 /DNA_ORIENTATION=+ /assembly_acc=CAM_ASM_000359